MQVDQNLFSVHMLELNNPKVLIRPSQAESMNGKNIFIGDERSEKKLTLKTPKAQKHSGGQDKKKKTDSKSTSLTGHSGSLTGLTDAPSKSGNSSRNKTKPSF